MGDGLWLRLRVLCVGCLASVVKVGGYECDCVCCEVEVVLEFIEQFVVRDRVISF